LHVRWRLIPRNGRYDDLFAYELSRRVVPDWLPVGENTLIHDRNHCDNSQRDN